MEKEVAELEAERGKLKAGLRLNTQLTFSQDFPGLRFQELALKGYAQGILNPSLSLEILESIKMALRLLLCLGMSSDT